MYNDYCQSDTLIISLVSMMYCTKALSFLFFFFLNSPAARVTLPDFMKIPKVPYGPESGGMSMKCGNLRVKVCNKRCRVLGILRMV